MRTFLCTLAVLIAVMSLKAQDIVTKSGQLKSVVLEEFTGLNCTFCPDGHRRAKAIQAAYPGRVVLVNVHAGFFATPSGNQPDYRTDEGEEFDRYVGVAGYPSGTVNRRTFNGDLDYGRNLWAGYSEIILEEQSPVNVGARSEYDENTRTLTVYTEVYYTQNSPEPTNRLIMVLLQDNIEGPQVGASANPDDVLDNGLYRHGNMLRDYIYGPFGNEITETTAGSLYRDTLVYQIPDNVRNIPVIPEDCHIGIYVANGNEDIQAGIDIGLNDMNDGNLAPTTIAVDEVAELAKNSTTTGQANFSTTFYPFIAGSSDYAIAIDRSDAPADWEVEYSLNGEVYSEDQTLSLEIGDNQDFELLVNPSSPGVARFVVTMTPLSFPETAASFEVAVVHEAANLIVNGEGDLKDNSGTARRVADIYTQAFRDSGINDANDIDANQFLYLADNDALDGIKHIYINGAWTDEALSSDMTFTLIPFMDGGGNVFMAGQDIAEDGDGSSTSQLFLSNYMKVLFSDDGNAMNNAATPFEGSIFEDFEEFSLFDYYRRGAFDPDEIATRGGFPAFLYNGNTSKLGGCHFESGAFKSVFFAFGLENVQDPEVRADLMKRVYQFFEGTINNEEESRLSEFVKVYPNPVRGTQLNIDVNLVNQSEIQLILTDVTGRPLRSVDVSTSGRYTVDIVGLASGVYFLKDANGIETQSIPVQVIAD